MTPTLAVILGVLAGLGTLAWWFDPMRVPRLPSEPPMTETDVLTLLATHARCCSHGAAETKALLSHYVTRVDRDAELEKYVRRDTVLDDVADLKALLSRYATIADCNLALKNYVELGNLGDYVADHLREILATEEFRARLLLVMREAWQRPPAFMTGQHLATPLPETAALIIPASLQTGSAKASGHIARHTIVGSNTVATSRPRKSPQKRGRK
jgi:hypothetical protein